MESIHLRLPEELKEKLKSKADQEFRSQSSIVREALTEQLEGDRR